MGQEEICKHNFHEGMRSHVQDSKTKAGIQSLSNSYSSLFSRLPPASSLSVCLFSSGWRCSDTERLFRSFWRLENRFGLSSSEQPEGPQWPGEENTNTETRNLSHSNTHYLTCTYTARCTPEELAYTDVSRLQKIKRQNKDEIQKPFHWKYSS